jgi:hypothetical protein
MDSGILDEMLREIKAMEKKGYWARFKGSQRLLNHPPTFQPKEIINWGLRFVLLNSETEQYNVFDRENKGVGFVRIDKDFNIVAHWGGVPGKWIYKCPNSKKECRFCDDKERKHHINKIARIMSWEILLDRIIFFSKGIKTKNFI